MAVGGVGIGVASPVSGGAGQGTNLPVVLSQLAAQGPSQSVRISPGNFVYDLFDRAPQALSRSISPTGNVWSVTGGNIALGQIILDPVKLDGTSSFVYTGTAAQPIYAYQSNNGVPITHAECAFSFASGITNWNATNAGGQSLTLALDSGNSALANLIHLNFGPSTWNLSVGAVPASFVSVGSGSYNILLDGTVYHIGMDINYTAQTITVNLPDGTSQTVSATQIGPAGSLGIQPSWSFLEIGYASTYFYPQFKGFVISDGISLGPTLRAFVQAAPMEEITNLRGIGMSGRNFIGFPWAPVQLTGGTGWYTIATGQPFQTFNMAGKVRVSVWIAGTGVAFGEFDVTANNHNAFPSISQKNMFQNASGFQQVRISTSASAPYSQLDIYVNTATVVNLFVEFIGEFNPVPAPVVGATALTNSVVQVIGIVPVKQAWIPNASTSLTTVLAAAGMLVGSIENVIEMTGAISSAATLQLPTVASLLPILANMPDSNFLMGSSYFQATSVSFKLRIYNIGGTGSGVWTVITNTGWTLNNTMSIASGGSTYRDFIATITSASNTFAGVLQSIGDGVIASTI